MKTRELLVESYAQVGTAIFELALGFIKLPGRRSASFNMTTKDVHDALRSLHANADQFWDSSFDDVDSRLQRLCRSPSIDRLEDLYGDVDVAVENICNKIVAFCADQMNISATFHEVNSEVIDAAFAFYPGYNEALAAIKETQQAKKAAAVQHALTKMSDAAVGRMAARIDRAWPSKLGPKMIAAINRRPTHYDFPANTHFSSQEELIKAVIASSELPPLGAVVEWVMLGGGYTPEVNAFRELLAHQDTLRRVAARSTQLQALGLD